MAWAACYQVPGPSTAIVRVACALHPRTRRTWVTNGLAHARNWHRNQDSVPVSADAVYVFRDLARCANKRGVAPAPGPGALAGELAY